MATEKTIKLKVENGEAIIRVDELNKALKQTNKETDDLNDTLDAGGEALDKFTKGGFSAMKSLYSGAKTAIGAMTTLKGAIISTGIGALVVLVGTLATYFTQTDRGADMLENTLGGLGAVVRVLVDRVSLLGEAVVKVLKGDFAGAAEVAKNAFKGLGEEIKNEAKEGVKMVERLREIEDAQRDLQVLRANANKEIAKARLIADDELKTTKEREQAVKRAFELENQIAKKEQETAQKYVKYIEDRMKLQEFSGQDEIDLAQARAKVLELQTENLKRSKRLEGELRGLRAEEKARQAEAIKEREEADKAEQVRIQEVSKLREEAAKKELDYQTFIKNGERETIELINKTNASRVAALAEFNNQINKIRGVAQSDRERDLMQIKADSMAAMRSLIESGQGTAEKAAEITAAQREAERRVNEKYDKLDKQRQMANNAKKLELAGQAFGALAQLAQAFSKGDEKNAKKTFAITKALRLGEAVANTAAAIMNQLASTPGPAGFVQAGIAAVTGAAQIATIAKSKFEAGKTSAETPSIGGAASSASSAGGGGFTPNISFTGIGQNPFGGMFGQPMQAYVVGQQMNNANMLERRIRNSATFGG